MVQLLAVDGLAVPGSYSLPVALAFDDARGTRHPDSQLISLLVRQQPHFQIRFYRDIPTTTVGVPFPLPVEVTNIGRNMVNVSTLELTSEALEIQECSLYVGPLDGGTSASLEATGVSREGGTAEVVVMVHYLDDFEEQQVVTESLTVEVVEPALPTPPAESEPSAGEAGAASCERSDACCAPCWDWEVDVMALRDLLSLVWSNLLRRKARVAMTAIGVAIGTAAVIVLVSLAAGLQQSSTESLGSVGELTEITVYSRGSMVGPGASVSASAEAKLDEQTLDAFRELPGVVAVTPWESLMGSGILRMNRLEGYAQIEGVDASQAPGLGFELDSGTARLGRWQVVVGGSVAERFYNPQTGRAVNAPGPRVPQRGRPPEEVPDLQGQSLQLILSKVGPDGQPMERIVRLRVTGVLEEAGEQRDNTLYLALRDVVELNRWFRAERYDPAREGYSQALVKVGAPNQATAVEQEIISQGFIAWSARSMLEQLNTVFLIIQGVFGGIGAIALVVAAFGIANTMLMAIYERTREIGLMKAIGATNRDVMSVFLVEAGGIGLLGGIGGILLGVGGGTLIDLVAGTYLAAQAVQSGTSAANATISIIHTPLWLPIFALLFSAVVGVVSSVYPAVQAASLDPIAALKYE